jgi:16S rRNA (cytosine1402-N4)-methyltransferase
MHVPVLKDQVLELLRPALGESYLDLTAGYGGHAEAVFRITKEYDSSVLVDQDETSIDYLRDKFQKPPVRLIQTSFVSACEQLLVENQKFDLILADIGVSSQHLDNASRGFSFRADGPLDMRMDKRNPKTAESIVNELSEAELAHILKEYGEEKQSKRIASAIVQNRPVTTTHELSTIIEKAIGWRQKGHHPATKSFQAIRIAVNDELDVLDKMLPLALQLLTPGGRFGVITFHSLEDRIVKRMFNEVTSGGYDAEFLPLTKKPVETATSEIVFNPRARSAKLRGVAKIKKERTE